jgi:hypothetical protein
MGAVDDRIRLSRRWATLPFGGLGAGRGGSGVPTGGGSTGGVPTA